MMNTDSPVHTQLLGLALRFREAHETHLAAGQALGDGFKRTLDELLDLPLLDIDS
jgi:hypothetical protein